MNKFRPTLKLTIGIALSGLILVTSVLLSITSYLSARSSSLQFSRDLIDQNARVVKEQVKGYLGPVKTAAEHTRVLMGRGLVSKTDQARIEEYYFDYLTVNPTISMFFYGDVRGNFLMVKRQPTGALDTKVVINEGRHAVVWKHRKPGATLDKVDKVVPDLKDPYDPRKRSWFSDTMKARDLYWTDVYVFYSDRMPGITVAVPYKNTKDAWEGVFTVNIGLIDLSDFLDRHIRVGSSGQAFLVDQLGQIVATRDKSSLVVDGPKGERRLRKLHESPRPEVAALAGNEEVKRYLAKAFKEKSLDPMTLRFSADGDTWVCSLLAIDVGGSRRWVAAVLAKEDDFLAGAKKASKRALFIALILALIALGAGLLLARLISRGLSRLVEESERVKNMDLETVTAKSAFRELNDVLTSFESMKIGLRAFQKYVPVKLVRQLLEERQDPELGGQMRRLTIIFSDIKGFTSMSEKLEPMELALRLGEYLSVVTRRIQDRQGTVDKYIGDAVMAFWGAPHERPEHAREACGAILEAMADLKTSEEEHPYMAEFFTRVGIHTATVVVGNFGSDDRLNYTVIGDGVNLASRLEGLNKVFGTQIIVSEETASETGDLFLLRRLAKVAVVGRTAPCTVYELMGTSESATEAKKNLIARYEEALIRYFDRDFAGALELLKELSTDDAPSAWLAARCATLTSADLPETWNGVITMEGK